eukprot:5932275-Amphidinium_carterae.1
MWIKLEKVPASFMDSATDNWHGYCNFHTEVQDAISDYINLYIYNYPEDYSQTALRFTSQSYYFTVAHTTGKLLEHMQNDLKQMGRDSN